MLYFTQLIFIKEGKEATFNEFESLAIPIISEHNGRILYRIRPTDDSYITSEEEKTYEIHFISFDSEEDFIQFAQDKRRQEFLHLKEESIKSTLLIKGKAL